MCASRYRPGMRRFALVGLVVVMLAHVPLALVAFAVLVLAQSFLAIVIAPALIAAVGLTFVTLWSLRPAGDGPRPAFGVAGLAALQGIVLASASVQSDFATSTSGSFLDLLPLARALSLVVAIALVVDGGLIAVLASVVQSAITNTPISPLVRTRLIFGAIALALVVAVMVQWHIAKQAAADAPSTSVPAAPRPGVD